MLLAANNRNLRLFSMWRKGIISRSRKSKCRTGSRCSRTTTWALFVVALLCASSFVLGWLPLLLQEDGKGGEERRSTGEERGLSTSLTQLAARRCPLLHRILFPWICYVLIGLNVIPESITWQEDGINVVGLDQMQTSNPPVWGWGQILLYHTSCIWTHFGPLSGRICWGPDRNVCLVGS